MAASELCEQTGLPLGAVQETLRGLSAAEGARHA
jgi:hypothetical protein